MEFVQRSILILWVPHRNYIKRLISSKPLQAIEKIIITISTKTDKKNLKMALKLLPGNRSQHKGYGKSFEQWL